MKAGHAAAAKVAIYWDFENIHASLTDEKHGDGTYRKSSGRQEPVVQISPVMTYVASLGDVTKDVGATESIEGGIQVTDGLSGSRTDDCDQACVQRCNSAGA